MPELESDLTIPLGPAVEGLTFGASLAGKPAYQLDSSINISNCWQDSAMWTGSSLYFGLGNANYSKLAAGQGLVRDADCLLPVAQRGADFFDIYRATIVDGAWVVTHQGIDSVNSNAGVSVSGGVMAYTVYNPSGNWDIFLAQNITDDIWNTAVPFERNSVCPEDNAQVYADGTKIIFESTRLDGEGSACDTDSEQKSLWFSEQINGNWSLPTLIAGDPNIGNKNTQPWVDEVNHYLYWSADTECGCIRRIAWEDDAPVGNYETIITPAVGALEQGIADGKIVFVGEYSHDDDYVFFACAKATESGDGTDPDLLNGKWQIDIDLCVLPRN